MKVTTTRIVRLCINYVNDSVLEFNYIIVYILLYNSKIIQKIQQKKSLNRHDS